MNMPALRFPDFEGEWDEKLLGELGAFKNGFNADKSSYGFGVPFVNLMDIFGESTLGDQDLGLVDAKQKDVELYSVCAGDILFVRSSVKRTGVGHACYVERDFPNTVYSGFIIRYRCKPANIGEGFKKYCLSIPPVRKQVLALATSSANTNINQENLSVVGVWLPTLPEQKKIAAFLGVVDAKIAALRDRRAGLERYKRGLMQALFSQTLRFTKPDGSAFPDWEEKRLGEVLHEHKAKSTGKEEVFSVSVHKGLVNQIEHLGRSFSAANTDHYNCVKPNDIVYTKSPTGNFPLGIIKQSHIDEDVIVSPLYGVFTPETPALGRILHVHFESNVNVSNYLSPIVQKGAKNTINVTNAGFLSNKLTLPVDHDEQAKIADALSAMDTKIAAVGDQVAQMEAFKKGLLQQMFV